MLYYIDICCLGSLLVFKFHQDSGPVFSLEQRTNEKDIGSAIKKDIGSDIDLVEFQSRFNHLLCL